MNKKKAFLIARRDFTERVRSRAFRTTTALSAIAVAALVVGPTVFGADKNGVAVVVSAAGLREQVVVDLEGLDVEVRAVASPSDVSSAVRNGDADLGVRGPMDMVVRHQPSASTSAALFQLR